MSIPLPEPSVQSQCPVCNADTFVEAFPALLKDSVQGEAGKPLVVDDESSCFYHPTKKAEIPCEVCGRFLCALCDVELNGQHLCPTCIEKGSEKGSLARLEKGRTRYDDIALALAIVPMLFACITIVTAPATIYVAIRYWKEPTSIVHRTRWRFVVAILIACLQLLVWAFYGIAVLGRSLG
jgi:hypothetical protein